MQTAEKQSGGLSELFLSSQSFDIFTLTMVGQLVKNPPAMQETWVQSQGQEDPLEKGIAVHSSILALTEEPGGLQSMGLQRVEHD